VPSSSNRDAYTAIADPTRREILTLVRDRRAMAAGEIAEHFPSSRPAISRHLRVLRECGVLDCTRRGKEQVYSVNPEPLNAIRTGYLGGFARMQTDSIKALRRTVEGGRARRRR
jgi:DNA-binding transcriptional ArsR family regulator